MNAVATTLLAAAILGTTTGAAVLADEAPPLDPSTLEACKLPPDTHGTSEQLLKGKSLMIVMLGLQAQGEANFRPLHDPPKSRCRLEEFDVGSVHVATVYTPFEKGAHTLNFRFVVTADGSRRNILAIYDGAAGVFGGGPYYIVEARDGHISYYAQYAEQANYAAVKAVVTDVLAGRLGPLASTHWPAGAKEPDMDVWDAKRLK